MKFMQKNVEANARKSGLISDRSNFSSTPRINFQPKSTMHSKFACFKEEENFIFSKA